MKIIRKIKEEKQIEDNESENGKPTKRKILLLKSTTDLLSFTTLAFQKTRKLNPPANLMNGNKGKESRTQ